MSVSPSAARATSWEDLEKQHILRQYSADAGNGFFEEAAVNFDPAGGLERDEIAELVAFERHGIFAFLSNESQADTVEGMWELSFSPDAELTFDPFLANRPGEEADAFGSGTDIVASVESDSPDVLYFSRPHQTGTFADNANGTGGSGSIHMDHGDVNYREMYGAGPTADRHDTLYEHVSVQPSANVVGTLYVHYSLYWDILEAN